jgi:hypothetical protein
MKVERIDFSHFLSLYAPYKLPSGRRLRSMLGTLMFCIDGYDDDPREIHTIPEVRSFYSAFHQVWPYWLYFCDLNQDGLRMMTFCCLKSFTAIKVAGQPNCAVEFDLSTRTVTVMQTTTCPLHSDRFVAVKVDPIAELRNAIGTEQIDMPATPAAVWQAVKKSAPAKAA